LLVLPKEQLAGWSIVLVEHDMRFAMGIADKIVMSRPKRPTG
jgi:ABC-type branched-subunit amino acid transport system ATPase component